MLKEAKDFWNKYDHLKSYEPDYPYETNLHFNDYLNEERLGNILNAIFENVTPQYMVKFSKKTIKIDYRVLHDGKEIFVEFNGYRHYTNSKTIERDEILFQYCSINNIMLVSIPYWVQLDSYTFEYFFGKEITKDVLIDKKIAIMTSYPSGFINEKALRPLDFSVLGLARFIDEYMSFIRDDNDYWRTIKEIYCSLENDELYYILDDSAKFINNCLDIFEHYPT